MTRCSIFSRARDEERGVVLVITALIIVALIGVAAIVVDLAALRQDRRADASNADFSSTAGASALNANFGGTPFSACEAAWAYFLENAPDAPSSAPSPCATFASPFICAPSTGAREATTTAGDYTVTITIPVPNDHRLLASQPVDEAIDGTTEQRCERIGVTVTRKRTHFFAGVLGVAEGTTTVSSVARAVTGSDPRDVVALLLLEPEGCNALVASGQAQVRVRANEDKPGIIVLDSSGTGGSGNNSCTTGDRYVVDALGTQNTKIIADGTQPPHPPLPGIIRIFALQPGQGTSQAFDPTDVTGARLSPTPRPSSKRIGRIPVDHRYNCKAHGRDGVPNNEDDCPKATGGSNHIDELVNELGGAGTPPHPDAGDLYGTAYQMFPRPGNPGDSCSPGADLILPAGNWWVNCPSGFKVQGGTFTFSCGNVVFQAGVETAAQSSLRINSACGIPTDGIVFLRSGNFVKGAQSSLILQRTFVYLSTGVINFGAGDGALSWIAPDDVTGDFDDLALWSESPAEHNLGGQAALEVEGVFFTPNADPFKFTGQAGQQQANAQFITRRLEVTGQGTLNMRPDPDKAVPVLSSSIRLIR